MILDKIIATKRLEIENLRAQNSLESFSKFPLFKLKTRSLKASIKDKTCGIIAEIKRQSPSKGILKKDLKPRDIAIAYRNAGAAGISVLTDNQYFGGSLEDLLEVRAVVDLPILRKEFIIDPIQLHESKAHGADVILLIAAALSPEEILSLSKIAQELGMEVLLEVHNKEEALSSPLEHVDILGVNNRDLHTFKVSLDHSFEIASLLPKDLIKISESGINSSNDIKSLMHSGYSGFLIGESFIVTDDPGVTCASFIKEATS